MCNGDLLNEIKSFISKKYNLLVNEINILWNNENLVFQTGNYVFRVTKFTHRIEEEINVETQLLYILHDNWASVAKLVPSLKGNLYEKYEDVYISCFEYVDWEIITVHNNDNNDDIIKQWGKTMWKIHKITSENIKKIKSEDRLELNQEIIISNAWFLLPSDEENILFSLNNLLSSINKLWINNDNYWLVHTDMRPRNFHYKDWMITHFDFDDISRYWYVYDIAVAIFHETENFESITSRTRYFKHFLKCFLDWYMIEKSVDKFVLKDLINFVKLRLIYSYIDYYKRLKIKWVDSWKEKMILRKKFIINFESFIDTKDIGKMISSYL